MTVVWTEQARADLRAIQDFIARDSELYARQQIGRLIERAEYASSMPTLGHPVHEFPSTLMREIHEGSYRIVYSFDEDQLQVITVIHMKQLLRPSRLRRKK